MLYLDDRLPTHPKILKAGDLLGPGGASRALHLYLLGLAYARQNLTDGFIPESFVSSCGAISKSGSIAKVLANRTIRLWRKVKGGYQIHDYHAYNPKAFEVKEKRARDRQRKQAERSRRNETLSAVDISRTRARAVPVPRTTKKNRASTSNQLEALKSCEIRTTSINNGRDSRVRSPHAVENRNATNPDHPTGALRDREAPADRRPDDRRQRVARAHQVPTTRPGVDLSPEPGVDWRGHDPYRTRPGQADPGDAVTSQARAGPTATRTAIDGTTDRSAVDLARRVDRRHQTPEQAA